MSKLRATRAQVIAAAIIVVLAVALGGVGLYGMNARGSENGAQVLENMRLQAILNTAGSGAVDAYVAAAKSEASTKARESGGGMSAVREAAAKAEEEARAKAEELGIGAVDLSEIDTQPMSAALDVLLAAQQAYFAEEASAQAAYAAQQAQTSAAVDDTAADAAGRRYGVRRHGDGRRDGRSLRLRRDGSDEPPVCRGGQRVCRAVRTD